MKSLLKTHLVCLAIISLLVNYGCKKSDSPISDMSLNKVKVYDDTLADIRNHSINIAAGSDQLYMTYGVGNALYFDFLNGLLYAGGFGEFNAKLMATDFDGNLKWIKELPANRMADDILVLDNGDVVVGTFTFGNFSSELNLIRFDKNGEKIVEVTAPISSGVTGVSHICLVRAFNGNIIVSGAYSGLPTGGYVCEYDLNFNQIWYKGFYNSIDRALATENNNYLFIQESYNDSSITVLKTNASGDSIWSKPISNNFYQISSAGFYPGCNDFVKNSNGNYVVSVSSRVSYDFQAEIKSYLYEINANGDLLNSTSSSFLNFNCNAALVPKKAGGVFALMQSYLYDYTSLQIPPEVFNEIHSGFAIFDEGLSLVSNRQMQSITSDHLTAACNLPTGEIACFGLIKSEGKIYYKPELIIVK
jgi:hypothetical protein